MSDTQSFGKYQLVERIAVGGMAEIYRAKTFGAAGFEKDLVIKRILPQFSADQDFVRMFIEEARLAAKLHHANIVQIFDFDRADSGEGPCYYIAMEWVEGKDVRQMVREGKRQGVDMPIGAAMHIVAEALKGLHYAHTKTEGGRSLGIVHRDVSPHNLLVSYSGEVKLSDFGIAKAAARAWATSNGMVKGKLGYMSPEQVTGQSLDRRTDLYSAGIVLYEMLTGSRLFAGSTDAEIITKVRDAEVPPPRERNPAVPADVEAVVLRMLKLDPNERFQTAAEASLALSQTSAYTAIEGAKLGAHLAKLFPPPEPPASDEPTHETEVPPVDEDTQIDRVLPAVSGLETMQLEARPGPAADSETATTPESALPTVLVPASQTPSVVPLTKPSPLLPATPAATWGRWVLGPSLLLLVAGATWALAGRLAASRAVHEEAPRSPQASRIDLTTTPPGATVLIDGRPHLGSTPTTLHGVAGERARLTVRRLGYKSVEQDVLFGAEPRPLALSLERDNAAAPRTEHRTGIRREARPPAPPEAVAKAEKATTAATTGTVSFFVYPWAQVHVDGRRIQQTPLANHEMTTGRHKILLANDDLGKRESFILQVRPGKNAEVRRDWKKR